jgi:hypothetical protein
VSGLAGVDGPATARGGALATVIALPAALVQLLAGSGAVVTTAMLPVIFVGFGVGGYVATSRADVSRLASGTAASVIAFAVVQVLWLAAREASLTIGALVTIGFRVLLAASCGVVGGWIRLAVEARHQQSS